MVYIGDGDWNEETDGALPDYCSCFEDVIDAHTDNSYTAQEQINNETLETMQTSPATGEPPVIGFCSIAVMMLIAIAFVSKKLAH